MILVYLLLYMSPTGWFLLYIYYSQVSVSSVNIFILYKLMMFYRDAGVSVVAFHPTRGMAVSASYGGDFKVK